MPYGTIKIDTITFTDGGVDKSVPVSGLVQNPTFTGNVTVTGTISGNIIQGGTTVSGLTVTGTTANFASGVFTTQISGVTITGTTVSTTTGNFTSLTGTTATITSGIIASGTAALPSLAILSDPNTGIYSPGADQLAVATNGTGRLFVDAAGGVTVPTRFVIGSINNVGGLSESTITTAGVFNTSRLVDGSTNPYLQTGAEAGIVYFNADGTSVPGIVFRTAGAERLRIRADGTFEIKGAGTAGTSPGFSVSPSTPADSFVIDSSGRLGIGTSSVSRSLHVAQANSTAYSSSDFEQDYQILRLNNTTNDGSVGLEFQVGTNGQASITADEVTDGNTDICFGTRGSGARTEKVRITSAGLVGIGSSTPDASFKLTIHGNSAGVAPGILFTDSAASPRDFALYINGSKNLVIRDQTASSDRLTIDSSGRLLVGTSSVINNSYGGTAGRFQVAKDDFLPIGFFTYSNVAGGGYCPYVELNRARGTQASPSVVGNNDDLGLIHFYGHDGSTFIRSALIGAAVDGTPGANDMPGRLVFSTTADGASSPTERMRINSAGHTKFTTDGAYTGIDANTHGFRQTVTANWTLFCTNSSAAPVGIVMDYTGATPNNTSSFFLYCSDSTAVRANIRSNGGLANFQSNDVNLSDRNVKKDISPAANTWNCIKEWEIVNYRYKDQPDDANLNVGVIAQQIAESCPEVITIFQEAKDATEDKPAQEERLGVREQQMYWMAIKALQEAMGRIEQLEAKVAALESA